MSHDLRAVKLDRAWWHHTGWLEWERADHAVRVQLTVDMLAGLPEWQARDPGGAIVDKERIVSERDVVATQAALDTIVDRVDAAMPPAEDA